MSATKTKDEVVKDFRTGEIVRAARRVIAKVGFDEASMDRIAHEASIAKGTIYLYFRNKEELLAHVAEDGFHELMERARLATSRARGAEPKLTGLLRAALQHTAENREIFRALQERTQYGVERESALGAKLEHNREELLQFTAAIIERGAKTGELRACDSRLVARFLIEVLRGAIVDRYQHPSQTGVENDAEAIVDFFLHGVGATERER